MAFKSLLQTVLLSAAVLASGLVTAVASTPDCNQLQMMVGLPLTPVAGGRMAVPVKLKDRPSLLLFDTGGSLRSLTDKVVSELGLPKQEASLRLINVKGKSSTYQTTVPLTLGPVTLPHVEFLVLPPEDGKRDVASTGADGVFPLDLMHNVDYDIDFSARRLNIFSQAHCPGRVVYWAHGPIAVVPFDLDPGNHITLPVTVDGKAMEGMLDTGATSTFMDLDVAKGRLEVDPGAPDAPRAGEFTGGRSVYRHQFKSLAIDGVEVANPMIYLLPNLIKVEADTGSRVIRDRGRTMAPVTLGMSLLRKLHIYIAMKERKLYITAAAAPAAEKE